MCAVQGCVVKYGDRILIAGLEMRTVTDSFDWEGDIHWAVWP